jgi:nucleoside-diphosphate-sugar epimerase
MKTVLVTGASGFVGRHTLGALAARGFTIHAVSSHAVSLAGAQHHICDLLDPTAATDLIEELRPSHLLHLAWFAQPKLYWDSEENLRWLEASLRIARAFRRAGGFRLVVAGTCAEYEWNGTICSEQTSRVAPATLYGASKHALQLALSAWADEVGLSFGWARLFLLYGPHEYASRLVPSAIRAALDKAAIPCTAGTQVRDFQHVADAAGALTALLDSDVRGSVNIASGRPVPVKDVVDAIADQLDAHHLVELDAISLGADEPALLAADITRLRDEVGWRDRFDLATGLADTIAWWRQ